MRTASNNLHVFWDDTSVKQAMRIENVKTPADLAMKLGEHEPAVWKTAGDMSVWPKAWADETLVLATRAYSGITLGPRATITDHSGTHLKWRIVTIPASIRLTRAAWRLRKLQRQGIGLRRF